jgi:signal transduction histidine kinase/CheY-like chemotaxis protein
MSSPDPTGQAPARPDNEDSLGPYPALVLVGSVPLLVLAIFAYLISARTVESYVDRGNDAAALITAALVEREFEHWISTVRSHAGFPTFSAATAAGDVDEVRRRLEIFVLNHPRLDRAFVTDTTGLLWVDSPVAPESLGRRFADRDWFRGVSRNLGPYVSEVYQRHAEPRIHVVAVASPVRDPATDDLAGFMVAQIRLDGLSDLLQQVEVGEEGTVVLRDHTGSLVVHPHLDLTLGAYDDYAGVLPAAELPAQGPGRARYPDPFTGATMLASAIEAQVGDHRWTVISQQPEAVAFAPVRGLALRLGGAGLLMGGLVGGLLWGVARENNRRKQAEERLRVLNEELEARVQERTSALAEKEEQLLQSQKMEAVGRLAGGVAHDFNNLLTVILGSSDLLLSEFPPDAPERQEIEEVRKAAERAGDLTRQLLAFSRKQVMKPRILDVNESVTRMKGLLERVLGEDIDLVWRLRSGLHPVKFDPVQIEQVVLNLAVNARDAMPTGGKLTVETSNVVLDEEYAREHRDARSGPHVMLAVTDTGRGMDAETRQRIFEPFYTTKRLGKGTGLGLATVYGIVRQGGGNIWVYSEVDRGTTFKIYLPRTDEVPMEPESEPVPTLEPGTGTILVVEDEASVRRLVVRVLQEAGYDTVEAGTAEEAEAAFRERNGDVDLLFTDVVLPDLGGPELAARLQESRNGEVRVLYMSGYTDNAIVHHGVLDEGIWFIEKPLRPRDLLAKVREVMGSAEGAA